MNIHPNHAQYENQNTQYRWTRKGVDAYLGHKPQCATKKWDQCTLNEYKTQLIHIGVQNEAQAKYSKHDYPFGIGWFEPKMGSGSGYSNANHQLTTRNGRIIRQNKICTHTIFQYISYIIFLICIITFKNDWIFLIHQFLLYLESTYLVANS